MAHFTDEYRRFFRDLAKTNSKEWFDANRKRYEEHVKKPFAAFLADLIAELASRDPALERLQPKDAVGRINRDIRFSKDKTPYNPFMSAILTPGGRKDKVTPGLALRVGDFVWMAGGSYMPSKESLQTIRERIRDEMPAFRKLLKAKRFASRFGELEGEANKRVPKEFQDALEKEPLIARKQFYFTTELDGDVVTNGKLIRTIIQHWEAARPLNEFFNV